MRYYARRLKRRNKVRGPHNRLSSTSVCLRIVIFHRLELALETSTTYSAQRVYFPRVFAHSVPARDAIAGIARPSCQEIVGSSRGGG